MEYRQLTLEELKELEPEFKRFLATHQIQPEDWEQIKQEDHERMESLIQQFSDIVFDNVLGKVNCLEYRKPREFTVFYFKEEAVQMAGLRVKADDPAIDLTDPEVVAQLGQDASTMLKDGDVEVFTTEKPYQRSRKQEILQFWESGCQVSNEELFETLKALNSKASQ